MDPRTEQAPYDVLIAGGGPAGLSAALTLGRARKRVLLCDAGPRRNAAAVHIHTFVTRDGTAPDEFRRVGHEQLTQYPSVSRCDLAVRSIGGEKGNFTVDLADGPVRARRVLLCTGMIDVLPELDGLREVWGTTAFQCPYCHGWEVQDRPFAYLASSVETLEFALLLRGWSADVIALTDGRFAVPGDARARLSAAGVRIVESGLTRLVASGRQLRRIDFDDGLTMPRDVLFLHPPQRQVDVVAALGLDLDADGIIGVDEGTQETSRPGIHAAGDITSRQQAALLAAASGMRAAAAINHELSGEMATA